MKLSKEEKRKYAKMMKDLQLTDKRSTKQDAKNLEENVWKNKVLKPPGRATKGA